MTDWDGFEAMPTIDLRTNKGMKASKDKRIAQLEESVEQLEAQVRELARKNAELKQVPNRSDDAPRCPLRDGMTGEMGACDKRCGLLMKMNDSEQYRMCAHALIARKLANDEWIPVSYWNEVSE